MVSRCPLLFFFLFGAREFSRTALDDVLHTARYQTVRYRTRFVLRAAVGPTRVEAPARSRSR